MKKLTFVFFLLLAIGSSRGQDLILTYQNVLGPTSVDTVIVYFDNVSGAPIQIGAVNLSLVYQSACASYLGSVSIFEQSWGSSFEGIQNNNANSFYNTVTYDRRYQYGNTSATFPPTTILLSPNDGPVPVMRILLNSACASFKRLESRQENAFNEITNQNGINIPYIIGNQQVGLPVEWMGFEAVAISEEAIQLNWQTASEINNDRFSIEKSGDGENFQAIGTLKGVGNSQQVNSYDFVDKTPMHAVNYYRIKQIDLDGEFSYSDIRQVQMADWSATFLQAYPNPATDKIHVISRLSNSSMYTLRLSDLQGKVLHEQRTEVSLQPVEINLDGLAKGMYILDVLEEAEGVGQSWKIIKE
ncbi:MAG: T9SS type A sorting domain-containing protein [Bacteroidota bacterium]